MLGGNGVLSKEKCLSLIGWIGLPGGGGWGWMRRMNVCVTGGAGFIGSHLAEALCRQGAHVTVLDDLSSGSEANLTWKLPGDGLSLEWMAGSVCDPDAVRRAITGCDWVFHLAAVASVPRSVKDPVGTNRINLDGTLTCLEAAKQLGVKRFVFASSSAIYGDDADAEEDDAAAKAGLSNCKTEDLPPRPLTPYALQKYAGESYARQFFQLYKLPTVSLRFFNVFGPRQSHDSPYSGVIAKFATEMLAGRAPTIFGDGLQSRDFVFVKNVVEANLLAAQRPVEVVAGGVYNVGCGTSITLLQLVEDINRLTGQRLEPSFAPAREGDVRLSQSDIGAARRSLGYEPKVSWVEGLRETLDFYVSGNVMGKGKGNENATGAGLG